MTLQARRVAPTAVAAVLALAYVIVSPPSLDLAAHLLRAKLFGAEGFGLWNNWWYSGHHVPGYSVLFPPVAWLLTPQVAGALAAVGTAALFESLVWRHFGARAWLGALWFGAATATDLFTGRLTFAFGLLPAVATALALQRRRPVLAAALALLTALASPVAALFAALAGAAYAVGRLIADRDRRAVMVGAGVVVAALVPVLILAVAFPEGGTEPFTLPVLWPILLIAVVSLAALPKDEWVLRSGTVLYVLGCLGSYAVPSPVGSNAARLGSLLAGPLAALLWWRRRMAWLLVVALPLLYIQWQAPVRDVRTSANDPSDAAAYWKPLLSFLGRQGGPPFRVEVPFTQFHFEAYQLAPRFPIPRGWERQLDIKDNPLFYEGTLTAGRYEQWLHQVAVRFVAVADVNLDYAGRQEYALIARGLPDLHLVMRSTHWRVYAVRDPTPVVTGAATLRALGPNSLTLTATRPGHALVRVHFTPYWALGQGSGCVAPAGDFTALTLRRPGPVRLVISFSPGRIGSRAPRCS
ncbi:MAG: hypothetical protein QOD66_141 [Solirubrobacteraceae bacterium]|nr:hypothetical protein [Solirubrobacteraceae bacterium]